MAKLEDILKSRGYSVADLEGIAPLLADQRFRSTLEESYGTVETERETLRADLQGARDVGNATIGGLEQQVIAYRRKLADSDERLRIAKDLGYIDENTTATAPPVAAPAGFDPKDFITRPDLEGTVKMFSEAEGNAMVLLDDLSDEYEH